MEAITEMRNPMLPGSDEAGVEQKERVSIVDFKMVTFSLAGKDYAIDIMKVKEIVDILKCQVLNEGNMEEEVKTACGSDMMSDVLAFVKDQSVLLTGLMNPQVVRTAEMMDMHCIVFVRGKNIDPNVVELARQKEITVLASPYRMFTACGLLYSNGLRGGCEIK